MSGDALSTDGAFACGVMNFTISAVILTRCSCYALQRRPVHRGMAGFFRLFHTEPRYAVRAFLLPGDVGAAEVSDAVAGVRVTVAPSKGGELASYQVSLNCDSVPVGFHDLTLQIRGSDGEWVELLHHGNDYVSPDGPGGWQGRGKAASSFKLKPTVTRSRCLLTVSGPNLFPAVGRNFTSDQLAAVTDGKAPATCNYVWGGVARDLGVHGFLKDTDGWEVREAPCVSVIDVI